MAIDEKLQYDIAIEVAKKSALSSGKIDKYEFLTGEETLSSDQTRMIGQAKFTILFSIKHLKVKQKQLKIKK